jgi:hypothetical protein
LNLGMTDHADAMRELAASIAFWRKTTWPPDFHNADYERWLQQNPDGKFTLDWWQTQQLPRLRWWIATRPVSGEILTARFMTSATALNVAWQQACSRHTQEDITTVTWEEVRAFSDEVGNIKPMKYGPSPVFTSKFCHFLLPRVFPVVDTLGLGGGWRTYEAYFKYVQDEWARTDSETQAALVAELTKHIVAAKGEPVSPGFPMVNKIVELRLIGRRHRID